MTVPSSAGARLRAALAAERPLQVVGTVNAFSALLAERAGFRALYLSGAGVANTSFGLPDLGITGNTHFPMSDLNNVQIADLLSEFLHRERLDRK